MIMHFVGGDTEPKIEFVVLGPLRVFARGTELPIAAPRQRALLLLLLLNAGRVVPTGRLIDQLWNGRPPPQGDVTLRAYVSNLRQALGGSDGFGKLLVTRGHGYGLEASSEMIDAERFGRFAVTGREHLRSGRPTEALTCFREAISLWRGDPLAEISDHDIARASITELTETYLGALQGRWEAMVATGRHLEAIPALDAFVGEHPLREEPHALLMLSLHRAHRTPEALGVFRDLRAHLARELGIDPSPRLRRLHQQILEQDPAIDAPSANGESSRPARTMDQSQGRRPSGSRHDRPIHTIVGRTRELALVRSRLHSLVTERRGGLILIAGEPGIGKSTLLEAVEELALDRDVAIHRGRSPAAQGAPAFWPWAQVVDSLAATLDEGALTTATSGVARYVSQLSTTVARRTGSTVPVVGDDPQTRRFLLYEAVASFMRQATEDAPAVLTFDDLHWADPATLELLAHVTPALADRPMLVVASYRSISSDRSEALNATLAAVSREDVVDEILLGGLGRADIATIARDLVPALGESETFTAFASLLHERTSGNPFFVRQLARYVADAEQGIADPMSIPIPAGVRHVVASRLGDLSTGATHLLDAAAIVGRDFDLRLAASAARLRVQTALDACDEAASRGLVEVGSTGGASRRFVHALVQEVVLDQLPPGKAARLHAAVGAQLQASHSGNRVELAEHLWAARDVIGQAAIPAQVAAAEEAAAVFAYPQAESHLRRALTLATKHSPGEPGTELTLLLSLFKIISSDRGWGDEDLAALVTRARELTPAVEPTDIAIRLWWYLFLFLLETSDATSYIDIATTLEESLRSAGAEIGTTASVNQASRAAIQLMGFFRSLAAGTTETARQQLKEAQRSVESATVQQVQDFDENLHVMAYVLEAYVAALSGDEAGHRSAAGVAIALADADGRPFVRAVARTLAAASGPYVATPSVVSVLAADALALNRRFGFGWLSTVARSVQIWAEALMGRGPADGVDQLRLTLESLASSGRAGSRCSFLLWIADILASRGDVDQSRDLLRQAQQDPGPYQQLMVSLVDRRLRRLR